MHDILRDVAHWIAKNDNKVIKCELEKDATLEKNSVRYLWCKKIPNDLDCSNLEFLYLKTNLEEFDEIFKGMKMLKVLIFGNENYKKVPLSSTCFKTLTNLRCLILSYYELSDFSFLRDMTKLQILSFFDCSLPSFLELSTDDAAVIQLTALKFLEFKGCIIKKKNFEVIKRTPLLEELIIVNIQGKWKSHNEDTIEFFKTFSVPQTLQRYRIVLGFDYFCEYDEDKSDRTLLFKNFYISNEVINGLAKKAKELFVANIQGGAKSIIPDIFQIEGECMNELNKLEIRNSEEIECLIDTSNHLSEVTSLFSKLHTLRIHKMEHLRALWHGFPPANGPFGNLEELYLTDCPFLTSLFTYVVARSLVQLKILIISRCDGLKHILADDDKTEKHKDGFTTEHPVQFVIFQNLEEVKVSGCRELKHIFSASIVGDLTELKELQVEGCDMLDQIIGDTDPLAYQAKKEEIDEIIEKGMHPHLHNSRLESNQLQLFKESTSIPSTTMVNHSLGILSSLATLTISDCSKLGSVFTISIAKTLTSLEKLTIDYCDGLKHIVTHERVNKNQKAADLKDFSSRNNFEDSWNAIFPNLKVLSVNFCNQLEYIIGQYPVANQDYKEIHIHFPALETLLLLNLPNFVNIGDTNVLSVTCPSLREFECVGCINSLTVLMDSREPISRSEKDPKAIQNHFLALQTLAVRNAEVKGIFCLNGDQMIGQQVSLRLEYLQLENLPQMTYIWVASKNSVTLQHLSILEIVRCAKLEVIFPPSILRSLPKLQRLIIKECIELKQIIEENEDDKKLSNRFSTQPCFPKLKMLSVEKCHKLKRLFYSSNDFPNLKSLTIDGASELEQIAGCEEGASKNSLTFHNLKTLKIIESAKLEVIFPKSVLRCLPELNHLEIKKCKELRQIISEDVEDKNLISPQPCFPILETLLVGECHKLKRIFSGSASNDLPSLQVLIISGASELEELIGCEQGKCDEIGKTKVELPTLKILVLRHLSNFLQEIELLKVKNCIVHECPKLSLTSTTTLEELRRNFPIKDFENAEVKSRDVHRFIIKLHEDSTSSTGSSKLSSSQINKNSKREFIEKDSGSEVLSIATSQEIGNVGDESMEEGPAAEVAKTKSLPTGVEDIGIGGGIVTHIESSGMEILTQDSKVVEQDDKMSEGKTRIVASQETKVQEGFNLLDNQEGIDIVSNSNIGIPPAYADIRTRLGAYKHFVDLDDAQINLLVEAITTYPHLWNACEKFTERFQAWRLKILADILLFLQNESVDRVIPQREKEFHKLCDEAAEIGFESSWVDKMRQRIQARDRELGKDIAQRQIDENSKRSSGADMVPNSQVVEQGEGPYENWKGTSPCMKIQNVNSSFQEGEISVVSNDRIVAPRNEDLEKEFVAKISTLDIPRIESSLANSQLVERPSPSYLNISQTQSNGLVDKQWISEPSLLKQEQPLEEISIKGVVVEETTAKNTDMATSSMHSIFACSQLDQLVTSQSISHPHSEIRSNQTKESEDHPKIIQDFEANAIMSLFAPVAVGKEGEDNRVGKTLDELRKYLKMSLEDIVSSETNSLRLLTALNFLSNLPFKDVTLSGGLKDVIVSMDQEFPSILCSFKQGFAAIDKLAVLEARQNEVDITFVSKISEAGNFMDEVQQKEVVLKEKIKVCEAALSSLEEEKNKCILETIQYKKELENVRKDRSQMVEDQRKVRQELFKVAYKWSALCSQFKYNYVLARNLS